MKILYLTVASADIRHLRDEGKSDAQSDYLFHGLRELLGPDVVDFSKKVHMYKGYPLEKLSGKGFTYGGNLEDVEVDRTDIQNKIKNSYFDLIVLSGHWTTEYQPWMISEWAENIRSDNPNAKIAIVLGQDSKPDYPEYFDYTPWVFRREIENDFDSRLIPISFAIPACKVVKEVPVKTRQFARVIPSAGNWPYNNNPGECTYLFDNEKDYYKGYQDSYFAFTCKKGGWNCHRHYEILANGCVPIFTDIEQCPKRTHVDLPKKLLSTIKRWLCINLARRTDSICYSGWEIIPGKSFLDDDFNYPLYNDTVNDLLEYTRKNLTTTALAKYFLEKIK